MNCYELLWARSFYILLSTDWDCLNLPAAAMDCQGLYDDVVRGC